MGRRMRHRRRHVSRRAGVLAALVAVVAVAAVLGPGRRVGDGPADAGDQRCASDGIRAVPCGRDGAGAQLPVSYDLAALGPDVRFVATDGSDDADGTLERPWASVAHAYDAAGPDDTIVVRGGTYRQGELTVRPAKPLRLIAHPGEVPVFNGAREVLEWQADGDLRWTPYEPRPVTDGNGIAFTTGQNLTGDGVGALPDQAWAGDRQLQQVRDRGALAPGRFWVDVEQGRLYVAAADVEAGPVEVSARSRFARVQAPGTSFEGVRITRFSNSAADYGVLLFEATADRAALRHVEVSDSAFMAVFIGGSGSERDLNQGAELRHVTVASSGWMGVNAVYTDGLLLDSVEIRAMNVFGEFTRSPQSGALKTSRARATTVVDSVIADNDSHGLWFDQSNVDVDVARTQIVGNSGVGVFFEISDDLLLVDSYIRSSGSGQPVKLAGSSGLKLVNNTVVGGLDPVGIYVDSRSRPGCAEPGAPPCGGALNSDRDNVREVPPTLDWLPRLDLMINNIVAYPDEPGLCGMATTVCVLTRHSTGASVPIESVVHGPDPDRGIPATRIDGNVYANADAQSIVTPLGGFRSVAAFATAMAAPPVRLPGLEAQGHHGNFWVDPLGVPTEALAARHDQAVPVPEDEGLNRYLPAGTRHYGVVPAERRVPAP